MVGGCDWSVTIANGCVKVFKACFSEHLWASTYQLIALVLGHAPATPTRKPRPWTGPGEPGWHTRLPSAGVLKADLFTIAVFPGRRAPKFPKFSAKRRTISTCSLSFLVNIACSPSVPSLCRWQTLDVLGSPSSPSLSSRMHHNRTCTGMVHVEPAPLGSQLHLAAASGSWTRRATYLGRNGVTGHLPSFLLWPVQQ